ncbi:two-component sensor histidine kinase [Streptomyces sp. NA02950]|uniref:sensor histidine kinase n=1 Tax=Streptomyces sp. NA02950 TaxID=2742137 RepID=UPI0015907A3B|nr:histidine kinase [Streptomyces sp. NA02950]QKV94276.1 two-component sensor histidine kinase [Streptomyces sp. NA02950]
MGRESGHGNRYGSWRTAVRAVCGGAAGLAVVGGLAVGSAAGWVAAVSMVVAVGATLVTVGWWPRTRARLGATAAVVAVVSAVATVLTGDAGEDSPLGVLMLVEFAAVTALVFVVTRFAPAPQGVPLVLLLSAAGSTVILRVGAYESFLEAFGQCAFMGLGAIGATLVGGYLRALDARRLNSVRAARRSQRLELARDLHDFVAHDVSGIVVLAQAAQLVGAEQPERLMPLLRQIEAAGQQALRSMDRTVRMLGDADTGGGEAEDRPRTYGLEDITDVVERFRSSGRAEVRLELELTAEAIARVPREVASTAHRMVVEALTNVRRHARTAATVRVRVALERRGNALAVSVVNGVEALSSGSGGHVGEDGRRGGTGLLGLTERIEALGGTLSAGPDAGGGWRTAAVLPLADAGSTPR